MSECLEAWAILMCSPCSGSVFVHRYRDADPGIRADCVRELGKWMKTHPAYFLSGTYLRYVGWLLSDMVRTHSFYQAFITEIPPIVEHISTLGSH